jgi:hypothetical protein
LRRPALILFCWVEEIRRMMGERRVMQEALFYGFSLERHIPDNHLLCKIDRFVDLSEVRTHLEPYYSETGRPSIDPELMIRMLIYTDDGKLIYAGRVGTGMSQKVLMDPRAKRAAGQIVDKRPSQPRHL